MDLNEYQELALSTAVYPQNDDLGHVYTIIGLANEAGELAGAYKKYIRGDYGRDELKEKVVKELGDVLWYIANVADTFAIKLNDVAEANVAKLLDRKERGVLKGSGDER